MDLFAYLISRNRETSTITGTEIDLTDAFDTKVRHLEIDATETTQGENPSPDNPQDVETMTSMVLDDVGKNLFNINGEYTTNNATATISDNTIKITGSGSYSRIVYETSVVTGETYTLSTKYSNPSNNSIRIIINDVDDTTNIASVSAVTTSSGNFVLTFVPISDKIKIRLYSNSLNTTNTNQVEYSDIQVEQGSTATSYEPYQHKQYPISLANQELLNNGNYVDKIIVDESTGQSYIEKVWGKVVLDGSENWRIWNVTEQTNLCHYILDNVINYDNSSGTDIRGYCNNYIVKANADPLDISLGLRQVGDTTKRIYLTTLESLTTLELFKTYLSTHNATLYYVLATPQLIPIDNPNIKLLNGVNHITNSEGAEMTITYVKSISDVFNKYKYVVLEDDESTNKCKKKRRC